MGLSSRNRAPDREPRRGGKRTNGTNLARFRRHDERKHRSCPRKTRKRFEVGSGMTHRDDVEAGFFGRRLRKLHGKFRGRDRGGEVEGGEHACGFRGRRKAVCMRVCVERMGSSRFEPCGGRNVLIGIGNGTNRRFIFYSRHPTWRVEAGYFRSSRFYP